jgi:hypothetical protein
MILHRPPFIAIIVLCFSLVFSGCKVTEEYRINQDGSATYRRTLVTDDKETYPPARDIRLVLSRNPILRQLAEHCFQEAAAKFKSLNARVIQYSEGDVIIGDEQLSAWIEIHVDSFSSLPEVVESIRATTKNQGSLLIEPAISFLEQQATEDDLTLKLIDKKVTISELVRNINWAKMSTEDDFLGLFMSPLRLAFAEKFERRFRIDVTEHPEYPSERAGHANYNDYVIYELQLTAPNLTAHDTDTSSKDRVVRKYTDVEISGKAREIFEFQLTFLAYARVKALDLIEEKRGH